MKLKLNNKLFLLAGAFSLALFLCASNPVAAAGSRTMRISLEGNAGKNINGTLVFLDASKASLGQQSFTTDTNGEFVLSLSGSPLSATYIRIQIPGFLSELYPVIDTQNSSAITYVLQTLRAGDFNSDGIINSMDYSQLNRKWLQSDPVIDLNRDGTVNTLDFALMAHNWLLTERQASYQSIISDSPAPTGDTQAPSTPTNLSVTTVSSSQVSLSWTASTDNVAVTGYRIYRGGTQIGTSVATNYSDTSLSAGVYSYTIAAYDAAGNVSAQSLPSSATVPSPAPASVSPAGYISVVGLSATKRNNFSGWVGYKFTVGSRNLAVYSIGRYIADATTNSHQLRITPASTGESEVETVVTLPSGQKANGFQHVPLPTPKVLLANHTYFIGSLEKSGGDNWYDWDSSIKVASAIDGNIIAPALDDTGSWYTTPFGANHGYVPLDFKYIAVGSSVTAPVIGVSSGADGTALVTITNSTPGATVRYTIDGSGVSSASPLYSGPFVLSKSAQIRSQAFLGSAQSGESSSFASVSQPSGLGNTIENFKNTNVVINQNFNYPYGAQVVKFDTDGNAVDAHDGQISYFNGQYYWIGTSYNCGFQYNTRGAGTFCGFKSYSSTDLVNWRYNGLLFDPAAWQSACNDFGCYEPRVVYNAKTGRYILWFNAPNNWAKAVPLPSNYYVLTASSPTGPFSGAMQPVLENNSSEKGYYNNGPLDLFVDDDGTAYIAYTSQLGEDAVVIEKLNADYTDSAHEQQIIVENGPPYSEPAGLFKHNGYYYVTYFGPCGYCPGTTMWYRWAPTLLGPWSNRQVVTSDCFGGQGTHFFQKGNGVLLITDLWHQDNTYAPNGNQDLSVYRNQGLGNYYMSPLVFGVDNTIQVPLAPQRQFANPFPGSLYVPPAAGNVDVESSGKEGFSLAGDIRGNIQRMQTFKPSRSGTLAKISITAFQSGPPLPDNSPTAVATLPQLLPDQDLRVDIVEVNANGTPGTSLASLSVPRLTKTNQQQIDALVGYSARNIVLSSNVAVTQGKEYGIIIRSPITTQGYYGFAYSDSNPYPSGREVRFNGTSWVVESGRALKFEAVIN